MANVSSHYSLNGNDDKLVTTHYRHQNISNSVTSLSLNTVYQSYDYHVTCQLYPRMNFPIIGMFFHKIDSSLYVYWNASILMRRWTTRLIRFPVPEQFFFNSEIFNNFQQKIIFRFWTKFSDFIFRNFIHKELNFDTDLNIAQYAKIENLSSGSEILEIEDMTGMMMRQV